MIELVLAHTDLARVRFAHSPVRELVASLLVLQDPSGGGCTAGGWRRCGPAWAGCGWSC